MPSAALVIAAENLMSGLRERLKVEGDIITFSDTEPIQALQAIMDQRPGLVVLERLFAATPRGAALINRIKNDPQLANAEVRVMSHTGDYSRQVVKPSLIPATQPVAGAPGGGSPVATEETPRPLDWHGTRRSPRFKIRSGVELQLDGNPASVVDLSTVGAQVISPTVLRPNQKVRITVPNDDFVLRFRGAIAWAKFELPRPPLAAPQYRAGVEFIDGDAAALDQLIERNRAS